MLFLQVQLSSTGNVPCFVEFSKPHPHCCLPKEQRRDIFRYLVLWKEGGYFADANVECLKPIDDWGIPKDFGETMGGLLKRWGPYV